MAGFKGLGAQTINEMIIFNETASVLYTRNSRMLFIAKRVVSETNRKQNAFSRPGTNSLLMHF
jgi:hypothetical protein